MSNDTVNRLEAAEDAWTKLGNKVTIVTGEMIASVAKATSSWKDFATFVFNHSMGADHPILQTPDINLPAPPPKPVDHKTKEEIEEAEKAAKKYAEAVKELKDAITPLTAAQQASAIALDQQGASAEQIAKVLKVSGTAVSKFLADLQNSGKDSLDDWAEIVRRHQEEQRDGEAATLAEIERLRQDELAVSTADLDDWSEVVKHHQEEQRKGEEATLAALKKNASESAKVLGDLSTALSQLAQVSGGAFGAVVSGLSQIVLSANAAEKAIAAMKSGMAKDADGKGKGLEGILEMSTGILGIVSAAMQAFNAVKSLFGLFDRSKGRDLVESFAETMGGFDALHQQLLTLGDEGEALWIKLTQGVGRNNPQQAQAAIDEVTKALDKQKEKQDQVGTVTEEAAIATIETATQASEALKTVGEQLETNKGQWSDWADSVMSDIARVAASVGAVMVPEPPDSAAVPGFAGGTHGAFLDFGAGTPVMLHGRERVVTEQEGRLGGGDVHVYIGNEQLDSRMVRVARKDAATGGLRTRATTGRSY
jgi:predicted transcriptional regulator